MIMLDNDRPTPDDTGEREPGYDLSGISNKMIFASPEEEDERFTEYYKSRQESKTAYVKSHDDDRKSEDLSQSSNGD